MNPSKDYGQLYEERIRQSTAGNDFILERGIIHFWRVEGKKDLAHFVLRPLPHLDWEIGKDPTLGYYEGPLLTLVEKRWSKNKGDKAMCVVESGCLQWTSWKNICLRMSYWFSSSFTPIQLFKLAARSNLLNS